MHAVTSFRVGLVIAGLTLLTGCGRQTPASGHAKLEAPRPIELPANLRPLTSDPSPPREGGLLDDEPETRFVPAQYEQPRQDNPRPSCLVDLSTTARSAPAEPVREPTPAPIAEPATAAVAPPPVRSNFSPIALPQPATAPVATPAPALPKSPQFMQVSRSSEGPQLTPPVQPGAPAPAPSLAASAGAKTIGRGPDSIASAPTAPIFPGPAGTAPSASPMDVISQRAMQMADQAAAIAQRGMFYSAQADLLQALQLIAQALDVKEGGTRHAAALAAGLTALEEARDFASVNNRPSDTVDVASIAANHRTGVLMQGVAASISPIVAQQQYFTFAQEQFAIAAGGTSASSQLLYRLGRLQTALSAHDGDPLALHGPQAIVYHQAALAIDAGNWLAANELGVLYARYGQLPQARQLLLYSLRVHPHAQGWENLAVVHRRLGETELAKLADNERQLIAQKSGTTPETSGDMVRWVDPKTFAATGEHDAQAPDTRYASGGSRSTPRR